MQGQISLAPAGGSLPAPRKIAIFRALQLGDMLCVVPALRALRAAAPRAHVTLIGMPWATSFAKRYSAYVDELLVFPGHPGFPEQAANLGAFPHFLSEVQRRRFDLALQLHGSGGLSNALLSLFNAERQAGHYVPGQYCPDADRFRPWQEEEHEVLRFVRLMEFLGMPAQGTQLEFPLGDADFRALQRSHADLPAPGTYVCVHPGARLPSRRWIPERFAEVADRLAGQGLRVVLTGSPDEAAVVAAVQRSMRMPSLDLSGKTELGALAALIASARLVVSNDTGISHVAAAVATPSVIVSCGSDSVRWAPLDHDRHHVLSAPVACRPCMHLECPIGHLCATAVSADAVAAAAARILAQHPTGALS
ncbi:glycosyltransferase family 9 protein [Noviherbaspirillum sp. 17J57-3]|uniref:Glycosyltransferase family 9 protein n=2 Tax=Noviherbaspirillum galbum TaxID=2709383 RepID=A0A6B3SIA9_9BURK|nr:glycosyltransferase family 9 protein [Noviherbaspirillum galbum]